MKFLIAAYLVFFIAILLYLLNIDLKRRALVKEIAALNKKLSEKT